MNEHARASELLAWKVNGRIDHADAQWLDDHLARCAPCRAELKAEQRVRDAIAREPTVEFAPQASFNRLWERIESERAPTIEAMTDADDLPGRASPMAASTKAARTAWARVPWLRLAVAAQAAVIVLLGALLWQRPAAAPAYRTVTDSGSGPVLSGGVIKAIFADQVRLGDVKEILQGAGLVVVTGPSEAGVYTLAPRDAAAPRVTPEMAARLRSDPRVRFAEIGAQ
jgi:hypothetical protein